MILTPNQRHAYEFYLSRGYSPAQAAGIVGGLRGETEDLNTTQSHDGGIGYGIAGWNGPRLQNLYAFAQQHGGDPSNLDTQLAFVDHELRGSESSAMTALQAAQDPQGAGQAMLRYFRPANWNAPGAHPERGRYAVEVAQGVGVPTGPYQGPAPRPAAAPSAPVDIASLFTNSGEQPFPVLTAPHEPAQVPVAAGDQGTVDLAAFQPRAPLDPRLMDKFARRRVVG